MKNIVIVGAGKGIGHALVQRLKEENRIFIVNRSPIQSFNTSNVSVSIQDATLDGFPLTDLPDTIDGLVYCPGSIHLKPFSRLTTNDFLQDFNQNVLGAVRMIQQCLPGLKRSEQASIVLISSVAAKLGMPFHSSISVAKAGVEGLVRSLASEFASSSIRVNAIVPSLTDTSLALPLLQTEEKRQSAAKRHPIARVGTPQEMAEAIVFLLSEKSTWITGQCISIDGGLGNLRV